MKKIFMPVFGGILFLVVACSGNTEVKTMQAGSTQQKNLAASNTIMKAFETGDVSSIDSVVSEDFLDHTDKGNIKGRDSLKAMMKLMHSSFKDMKSEKIHELADDEYVYNWMRYSGTSDGSMGMPNGPYVMSAMEVSKYKDGKATEHWSFMEMPDVMKMMTPPNMNAMDSNHKK